MLRDANGEERKGIEVFSREREMRRPVADFLRSRGYRVAFEVYRERGLADIIGVRFAARIRREVPPATSIIAVELKLDDVSGVLRQCSLNWPSSNLSCAAMPRSRVLRMRSGTVELFRENGFGLLQVDAATGEVSFVVEPVWHEMSRESWHSLNMPRKLWRMFRKEIVQQSAT